MTELKPCPFCRGTNLKLYTTHAAGHGNRRGVVRCPCGCELRVMGSTSLGDLPADMPVQEKYDTLRREAKEAVIAAWNRRAEP